MISVEGRVGRGERRHKNLLRFRLLFGTLPEYNPKIRTVKLVWSVVPAAPPGLQTVPSIATLSHRLRTTRIGK